MTEEINWIRTSVSARDAYEECNRKWYLRYRTDVKGVRNNPNATMIGTCAHRVLEVYYLAKPEHRAELRQNLEPVIAEAINFVVKQELANNPDKEEWAYTNQEEAVIFACASVLIDAMEQSGLTVIATERKVQIANYFTGVIDVIARTPSGHYLVIDYKNQANLTQLSDEVMDLQLRMYEAVASSVLDTNGKPLIEDGKLLGTAKLIAKKPTNKFRCKGHVGESFEQYAERAGATAQFVFVKANPQLAEEYKQEHIRVNRELNSKATAQEFPKNRKACIGKFGKCEFYNHCHPHSESVDQPGFDLVGEDIKHIGACLTQQVVKLETEPAVENFW